MFVYEQYSEPLTRATVLHDFSWAICCLIGSAQINQLNAEFDPARERLLLCFSGMAGRAIRSE